VDLALKCNWVDLALKCSWVDIGLLQDRLSGVCDELGGLYGVVLGGILAGVHDLGHCGVGLGDGVHETLNRSLLRGVGVDLMDGVLDHDLGGLGALDEGLLHGALGEHGLAGDCAVLDLSGINIASLVYC